jgi:DNA-binding sugar fermentation-stimulating protein
VFTSLILKFLKSSRFRTSIGRNSSKNVVVKKQNTGRLQNLEMMRNASKELQSQEQWEEDAKTIERRDNVADVVSMMTGFPNRMHKQKVIN